MQAEVAQRKRAAVHHADEVEPDLGLWAEDGLDLTDLADAHGLLWSGEADALPALEAAGDFLEWELADDLLGADGDLLLGSGPAAAAPGGATPASVGDEASGGGSPTCSSSDTLSAPPSRGALRCFDGSHSAFCARCTAPPSQENSDQYELNGTPGKKNGEKLLRALIIRTPEWASREARETTAALFEDASGRQNLVQALRQKLCSALRKNDMMLLAHTWRYKSDLWHPRGFCRNKKAGTVALPPPPVAPPPRPLTPPHDTSSGLTTTKLVAAMTQPMYTSSDPTRIFRVSESHGPMEMAVLDAYMAQLKPWAQDCAQLVAGEAARKAAWASGGPHVTLAAAVNIGEASRHCKSVGATWATQAVFARTILRKLEQLPSTHGEQPAYLTCFGAQTPAERMVAEVMSDIQHIIVQNDAMLAEGGRCAAEKVWLEEIGRGHARAQGLLARALAVVQNARVRSLKSFLESMVRMLDILCLWSDGCAVGFKRREQWMHAFMCLLGPGLSPSPILTVTLSPVLEEILHGPPVPPACVEKVNALLAGAA